MCNRGPSKFRLLEMSNEKWLGFSHSIEKWENYGYGFFCAAGCGG